MTSPRETLLAAVASVRSWYHVIELPHGVSTPGVFDVRPHLSSYRLPERLDGLVALDVGTASGYFAFELERRGARVIATDLASRADHDLPAAYLAACRATTPAAEIAAADAEELRGFEVARDALGSRVERRFARATQLHEAFSAEFDLVLLSNVLLHLRDPVLALEACRDVLKPGGVLVLASPVDESAAASYALFQGRPERVEWWVPSPQALLKMAAFAGFDGAAIVGRYVQRFTLGGREEGGVMAVLHARRPAADGAAAKPPSATTPQPAAVRGSPVRRTIG
jgi:tRNA (mo5U34)-methyltransferase